MMNPGIRVDTYKIVRFFKLVNFFIYIFIYNILAYTTGLQCGAEETPPPEKRPDKKEMKDQSRLWDHQVKDLFHRLGN